MRHADHFLITEAWRRAEQFEAEARNEHLLADYRAARAGLWRRRAARLLLTTAQRLEPNPSTGVCPECGSC